MPNRGLNSCPPCIDAPLSSAQNLSVEPHTEVFLVLSYTCFIYLAGFFSLQGGENPVFYVLLEQYGLTAVF